MFKKPEVKLQTTTLWEYPSQHYGPGVQGDKNYTGATPSWVVWNLLERYTRPNDLVIDPMAGSGTTLDVARELGRKALGYDVSPARPDIFRVDARKLPLEDGKADFVFVDPPYSTHVEYSDDPRCIGKLDAHEPAYYQAMEQVIREIFRVLKDRRYLALYVSDSFKKGTPFCPIGFELFAILRKYFKPVDIVAVVRHNAKLKRGHWHTAAVEGNYFLRGFNYLLIMKKEVATHPAAKVVATAPAKVPAVAPASVAARTPASAQALTAKPPQARHKPPARSQGKPAGPPVRGPLRK